MMVVLVVVYLTPCPSNNYCFPQDIYHTFSYCALFTLCHVPCTVLGNLQCCAKFMLPYFPCLYVKEGLTVIGLFLIVQLYILFSVSSYLCPRKPFFVVTEVNYILKVSLLSPC